MVGKVYGVPEFHERNLISLILFLQWKLACEDIGLNGITNQTLQKCSIAALHNFGKNLCAGNTAVDFAHGTVAIKQFFLLWIFLFSL